MPWEFDPITTPALLATSVAIGCFASRRSQWPRVGAAVLALAWAGLTLAVHIESWVDPFMRPWSILWDELSPCEQFLYRPVLLAVALIPSIVGLLAWYARARSERHRSVVDAVDHP